MFFIFKEILKKKSLARALFNAELPAISLRGRVLDVGGGRNQDYLEFLNRNMDVSVETVDIVLKQQGGKKADFEKDPLPFQVNVFDYILIFNVLEHIYNYHFLVRETHRVLKDGGRMVGFVPFLVPYHPDPRDYFRYTKEALQKILESDGFRDVHVKEVGRGPFAVNYNNLVLSLPLFVRVVILPLAYCADSVFLFFRPKAREKYPLGYLFTGKK